MKLPSREPLDRLVWAYRGAHALFCAVELDFFASLDGGATAEKVARRAGSDVEKTRVVLDALVGMGFVRKSGRRYRHTPLSRTFLVPGGPASMTSSLRTIEALGPAYAALTETVRSGRPPRGLIEKIGSEPAFAREYIRGMLAIGRRPAAELASLLDLRGARRLLDVGGGPGTFSAACLAREPGLEAAILDLPATLKLAAEILDRSPFRGRIRFLEGDYRSAPFGSRVYDVVLMSHITHDESEAANRALLAKAFRALKPGGRLAVHDFVVREDRAGPLFEVLFAVHLLTYTRSGRVYTRSEYLRWIEEAGFLRPKVRILLPKAPISSVAFMAVKP